VIGTVTDDPLAAAEEIARASIPYEVSSDVNRILDIKESVASEFKNAALELKQSGKATLKSIEKVLPKDSGIHKLTKSLLSKLSDDDDSGGYAKV